MKKNTVIILFLALFSGICSAQGPKRPDISDWFSVPEIGGYTYREEMVEGGDLCKLLTRIYLPEGDGPWPVVVTRTPYVYMGRGDTNMIGREYAKRGIGYISRIAEEKAVLMVSSRRTSMSERTALPYTNGCRSRSGAATSASSERHTQHSQAGSWQISFLKK